MEKDKKVIEELHNLSSLAEALGHTARALAVTFEERPDSDAAARLLGIFSGLAADVEDSLRDGLPIRRDRGKIRE